MFLRVTLSLALIFAASTSQLSAALLVDSEGNSSTTLSNGDLPTILQIVNEQAGQPAPFDAAYDGTELVASNDFDQSWTHTYANLAGETIIGATLTIGIVGHDSAATGDQIAVLETTGGSTIDLTGSMNTQFENSGGGFGTGAPTFVPKEYNTYTIDLPNTTWADLLDGNSTFHLALQNPDTTVQANLSNAAHLIFATITIETLDGAATVPEPSSMLLLSGVGLFGLARRYRRRKLEIKEETAEV